jgi:hypothetical protein
VAKQSQIEKAIAALEADKAVLELAIAKLKAQQDPKPVKVHKVKAASASIVQE